MNDLLSDPKNLIIALLGILMTLIGWIGKGHLERLRKLEAEAVRKADMDQLRGDMDRRHDENVAKLDSIETAVTGTHHRIDDLYRDLIGLD